MIKGLLLKVFFAGFGISVLTSYTEKKKQVYETYYKEICEKNNFYYLSEAGGSGDIPSAPSSL